MSGADARGPRRGERGFALVAVLWILVLLTAIVGEFAYSMRTEANIARNFKEATQAHYIARSGLLRAVAGLLAEAQAAKAPQEASAAGEPAWRVNVPIPPRAFGAGEYEVRIENTAGLVDLNTASEGLLRLMAGMIDAGDRERAVIVDSILDWRDPDDLHRLNGAEDSYYRSLPRPYRCKNAPFDSVDELVLVRGMSPELLTAALRSVLVVVPGTATGGGPAGNRPGAARRVQAVGQLNVNAAPRHLLEALPAMTPDRVEALLAFRAERDFRSVEEVRAVIGGEAFSAIAPYITLALSPYYEIRAEGRVAGSAVRQNLRAMVHFDEALPAGYEMVAWQEQYY
jgi:general secretion pathway protein K